MKPSGAVAILGFNSPEWLISLFGAIFAAYVVIDVFIYKIDIWMNLSGVANGVYTTNSPEACEHVINDSLSEIVVVENDIQLKKILKIKNNCKSLKAIVQYTGDIVDDHNGLVISVNWLVFVECRMYRKFKIFLLFSGNNYSS